MNRFEDLFEDSYEFYLDKIDYRRLPAEKNNDVQRTLSVSDTLETNVIGDKVKILIERKVGFEPEELFFATISFGAILTIKNGCEEEIREISEADRLPLEFAQNGQFVCDNLMNRISLVVANITSSFGQSPLVLPPNLARLKMN